MERFSEYTDSEVVSLFADAFGRSPISLSDVEEGEVGRTSETIADWLKSRENWAEGGSIRRQTPTALYLSRVQLHKGTPRRDVYIVAAPDDHHLIYMTCGR